MKHIKLFEVHHKDMFSDKFLEFKKKYNKEINNYNLYVQFTNFKGDVLDRTSHTSPNHSDPVGNYAYPLKYVIQHPADLWYGMNATNLRILEKTSSCNTLLLSNFNGEDDCIFKAMKLNPEWRSYHIKDMINIIKKEYKKRIEPKNVGYWGRVFFQILQVDFSVERSNDSYHPYPIRSSIEQTKMLLHGGWNAIEDESKKDTTAIINDREPEQICFLDRKSFKVVEIFNLKGKMDSKSVSNTFSPEQMNRKWISKILDVLDDKIKEEKGNIYFSVKGREIFIEYLKPESHYDNRKIGQKLHKSYKLNDEHSPRIVIQTEKGDIVYKALPDETLSEILISIKNRWDVIKNNENVENWIPRSIKQKEETKKKEQLEHWAKEKEKQNQENIKQLPNFINRLKEWKQYLNSDFKISPITSINLTLLETFESISKFITTRNNINEGIKMLERNIDILKNGDENDSFLYYNIGDKLSKPVFIEYLFFIKEIAEDLAKEDKMFFYQRFYNKKLN